MREENCHERYWWLSKDVAVDPIMIGSLARWSFWAAKRWTLELIDADWSCCLLGLGGVGGWTANGGWVGQTLGAGSCRAFFMKLKNLESEEKEINEWRKGIKEKKRLLVLSFDWIEIFRLGILLYCYSLALIYVISLDRAHIWFELD